MSELAHFDSLKADLTIFVGPIKGLTVSDASSNQVATETLSKIKNFQKLIEGKRTDLVKPLNDQVKLVNEYAKEITAPLIEAEGHVKRQMSLFAAAEYERRMAEKRKLDEDRRKADEEARKKAEAERKAIQEKADEEARAMAMFGAKADPLAAEKEAAELQAKLDREQKEREKSHRDQVCGLEASRPKNTRTEWRFEIEDPSQVPRDFMAVDETAIRRAIVAGARTIPGVRIFSELVVVAR
jgi:hypothetical protein